MGLIQLLSSMTLQLLAAAQNSNNSFLNSGAGAASSAKAGSALETALNSKAPLASPTFTGLVTTAGQIKFPSAINSSSDANTLDDYEEGTWTPTIASYNTQPTVSSYADRLGTYIKIGQLVVIFCRIRATISNIGTGYPIITGLPFTNNGIGLESISIGMQGIFATKPSGAALGYINGGSVIFETATWGTGGGVYLTFTGTYTTT